MRIFSSAECCFRVRRRMSFATVSAGALDGPDYCLISIPCGYDEPETLRSSITPIRPKGAHAGYPLPPATIGLQ